MNFKQFYLKENEDRYVIRDDKFYVDIESFTDAELKKISNMLNAADYDIRSPKDLKELVSKHKFLHGEKDKKFYIIFDGDWSRIFKEVLGIAKKEKPKKDILKEVLKNIKKETDISIGRFVNSSTGYILPDGNVINLGGGHSRANDHRFITNFFKHSEENQTRAMEYFLKNTGTIRYIPELPGLEIVTKPTRLQIVQIQNVLKKAHDDLAVDFKSENYPRKAKTYPKGTNPKILERDVENYYSSGTIRDNPFLEH